LYAGAVLAGGNQKQIDQLQAYGRHIGLAFQIVDDVLNVTGDPNVTGKAIGTDATRRKSTYPALLGLEQSRRYARDAIEKALLALIDFDNKADPLRALAEFIIDREH
jgi:geranylgeranyl diphosphate synthase type II